MTNSSIALDVSPLVLHPMDCVRECIEEHFSGRAMPTAAQEMILWVATALASKALLAKFQHKALIEVADQTMTVEAALARTHDLRSLLPPDMPEPKWAQPCYEP